MWAVYVVPGYAEDEIISPGVTAEECEVTPGSAHDSSAIPEIVFVVVVVFVCCCWVYAFVVLITSVTSGIVLV